MAMMLQVNVFAADDNGLQDAVKTVKSKITIPSSYTEFNYRNGTEGDRKIWTLDWNSKEDVGSISVSVDDKGNILRYYNSIPNNNTYKKKLPKVSKQDARIKAENFIKKMNADLLNQITYFENTQQNIMGNTYSFHFLRLVNGIKYPENHIFVEVNFETGDIQSYSLNWTEGLNFPSKDKVISLEKAKSAYVEKLGLRLTYSYKTEDKKILTYPVYSPLYNNSFVDAITGEKVDIFTDGIYFGGYGDADYLLSKTFNESSKGDSGRDVPLTPDEIKAIEEVSKLISKEDMEKKLRGLIVLGLSNDFTVTSTSLDKDWTNPESFVWNFYFAKDSKDTKTGPETVNVSADAKTGEIKNFWISSRSNENDDVKYDKDASKAEVEEFLKEIQSDKFKQTEYQEIFQQPVYPLANNEEKPREYTFKYTRKVNGIFFPSNSISVGFDAVKGKITNYNMNWFDTTFQPVDKVIALDKMYEALFSELGLELQYKSDYTNPYDMKLSIVQDKKPGIKLVYTLKNDKPAIFDAFTGVILNSDGKPFKEVKPVDYKDIKGHFAEKYIKILAEYGIALEGDEFNPDKSILQKDFVKILCSILDYSEGMFDASNDAGQIDQMYKYLINQGVIKAEEKAPDSFVTRENSVKYIIRSLKYDKVADLKGIFNCTFKDKDMISADLIGYVVIADGLNIIKGGGGYFNPKRELTRAEAMIEAYNYLQN